MSDENDEFVWDGPWSGEYGIADDEAFDAWCDENDCHIALPFDADGGVWVADPAEADKYGPEITRRSPEYVREHHLEERVIRCRACDAPAVSLCHYYWDHIEDTDDRQLKDGPRIPHCHSTYCEEHYDSPPDRMFC